MIQDFNSGSCQAAFDADLCIVGSGPVGLALARDFDNTSFNVVLVESGGMDLNSEVQLLSHGESVGLPHTGHRTGRARAFGGTGKLWAGQCLRLDPIDFELRSWVSPSGWPITHDLLDPFYERAEDFFKVRGEIYDERQYARFGLNAPEWSEDALKTMFTVYTPETDTGKFSTTSLRQSRNITVLLNANVVQIETNSATTRAESVRIRTLTGKEGRVRARAIVLCAGGIENARLLLASTDRRPRGIGNDHDLVGRYFQEHPNGTTATVTTGSPKLLQALFRLLYRGSVRYFPKFALAETLQRTHGVLNCNAHLVFEYDDDSGIAALQTAYRALRGGKLPEQPLACLGSVLKNSGEVSRAVWARLRTGRSPASTPRGIRLQCYLEQAPNYESRVLLGTKKDALGMPVVQIDWRLTPLELKTLNVMTRAVAAEFRRLGLGSVGPDSWLSDSTGEWQNKVVDCAHHMGTTRMAETPRWGVVNSDCKVFGTDSLYVAGSSVFPTSGYANPTLTIVALAKRLADHLKNTLRTYSDASMRSRQSVALPISST